MFQCTGTWNNIVGTAVKIGGPNRVTETGTITGIFGKDIFLTDCIFEVPGKSAVKGNSLGLDLIAAEHVRLKGVRFDGFYQGILIRPGYGTTPPSGDNVVRCFFTDVTVFAGPNSVDGTVAGNALTIQPQSTNQQIGQLTFVGCTFEPGSDKYITSTEGAGTGPACQSVLPAARAPSRISRFSAACILAITWVQALTPMALRFMDQLAPFASSECRVSAGMSSFSMTESRPRRSRTWGFTLAAARPML